MRNGRVAGNSGQAGESKPLPENPSNHCPICNEQLESRKCKLLCRTCGYYMSCSDYY